MHIMHGQKVEIINMPNKMMMKLIESRSTTIRIVSLHIMFWFKHILFMTNHDKGLGRAK